MLVAVPLMGWRFDRDIKLASARAAHVCLLDALGIRQAAVVGGSVGAPSALQMAISHPGRISALILLVPMAYKPPTLADSVRPLPPLVENILPVWRAKVFVASLGRIGFLLTARRSGQASKSLSVHNRMVDSRLKGRLLAPWISVTQVVGHADH